VLATLAFACSDPKSIEKEAVSLQDSIEAVAIDSITTELTVASDTL